MIALLAAAFANAPTVLDDADFAFCHRNADHEYNEVFCALLDDVPEDRCPGLRAFCAAPSEAPSRGCNASQVVGEGDPGSDPAGLSEPEPEWDTPEFKGCDLQAPSLGAGPVLGWMFALLVAGAIGAIGIALLRHLGLRPDAPTPMVRVAKIEEEEQSFAEAVQDVPDLPSDDLLAAARRALAEQRFGEAAVLARGAVLRRLGERRVLKLHRARTDREYLRQSGAHRPDLSTVFDVAEQHRWGRIPLDGPRVEGALDAAGRLLAAVAVLLLWVPGAHGANERYGPAGDAGLQRVLDRHGFDVSFRLRGLEGIDEDGSDLDVLVIDTSGLSPTEEGWADIRAWVQQGHVLWIAGSPKGFPELGSRVSTSGEPVLADDLVDDGLVLPVWPGGPDMGFDGGTGWVVAEGADPVVVAPVGAGWVLAVADPVLLWNGSLVDPRNEAFLGDVLYRGQARGWPMADRPRVHLATMAASESSDNPAQSVRNLRLLPFVLQVLVFWLVLVAWRGWPFAPLADPPSRGRRSFVEHLDALARRYRQARDSRFVASAFARLMVERHRQSGLALAARRHGMTAAQADALARRAVELAENPEGPSSRSDFELMEELWKVTRPR
ncbi:MAG: hypothetical protein H6737_08475 [Alphaproteobacteria bacterium]|nr:hypothetical protein [Alphaproteobacteria bacterium]